MPSAAFLHPLNAPKLLSPDSIRKAYSAPQTPYEDNEVKGEDGRECERRRWEGREGKRREGREGRGKRMGGRSVPRQLIFGCGDPD